MPSPRAIVTLIILALVAALVGGALWQQGRINSAQEAQAQALRERDDARAERDAAKEATKLAEGQVKVVVRYVDRVQVVEAAAKVITKEIPGYVTAKADAACAIPAGFVHLHNAAAESRSPENAGDPDAPAAGLALSSVLGTVTDNYRQYHALGAQVVGLQEEVRLLHDFIGRNTCAPR